MKTHLFLIVSVIGLTFTSTRAAGEDNFCIMTSQAALHSCQVGAQSDFWLAQGKCANVSDPAGRQVCKQQARTARKDALTCATLSIPSGKIHANDWAGSLTIRLSIQRISSTRLTILTSH